MSTDDINTVVSVLNGILDPNNEVRNSYVVKLEQLRQNTPALFYCLVKIIESDTISADSNLVKKTKIVASVLGRKLMEIKDDEIINQNWLQMPQELKEEIKASFIRIFIKEKENNLRQKICDIIIQVAANVYENDEKWDELLLLLIKTIGFSQDNSQVDVLMIESSLTVLAGIFGYVFDELIKQMDYITSVFRTFFLQGDLNLRTRTARTIADMSTYCDKKELKYFSEFMFPLLETTLKCLEASVIIGHKDNMKAENNLKYCLKAITDISSSHPVLFKKHFSDLFTLMCKISETKEFTDENIREMGFEVIVNIVERRNNLFLKDEAKLKYFLELLFKYALEMDKEITDDWANPSTNTYYEEEFIHEEKVSTTFSFVDRLIDHLDCKFMLPYLSEIILQLIGNESDWRFKYVGLLAISQVMSYVEDMSTIENIFPTIFNHTKNSCPKIRYASVNCIDEMSDTFEPHFQANYHDKVIPILLERIASEEVLRVQLESLESLNTFISHQTDDQCIVYIQPLLDTLFTMFLKDIPINLRNEILESVSEIVATTEKLFTPYSEKSLKILVEFFESVYNTKTCKSLYGNLIECITLIGQYNMENYRIILPNMVKIIVEITESIPLSKDPIREYLQEALERIIPILKSEFIHLLPSVINSVLKLVQTVPEMSVSSKPEQSFKLEELLNPETQDEVKIQTTSVKTSQTEDMAESLELLNTTIEALQELFIPYIESTQLVVLPLLKYYINEDVRQRASDTLPLIMEIVTKYSSKKEDIIMFAKTYISELIQVIEKEFDNETLSNQLENLGEIILKGGFILTKEELNMLFSKILVIFDDVEIRRLKLLNKESELKKSKKKEIEKMEKMEKDDDEPDSDEELLDEIEKDIEEIEQIQSDISDVVGFLFKTHKEISEDIVNKIIKEMLPKYFRENASPFEIKMGIFFADDMIEYLGQDYLQSIWNDLAQVVIKFSDSQDCSIRQAACYGIGVFSQYTKHDFNIYIDEFLKSLVKVLSFMPNELNEQEWGLARDNGVTALGKIIKYQANCDKNKIVNIINMWLKYLPLTYDINECPEQHELLCDIFLNNSDYLLGENYINLPTILRIFAKIYKTKFSVKEVNEKIERIFIAMKNDANFFEIATQTMESSEDKIKKKLNLLLSNKFNN